MVLELLATFGVAASASDMSKPRKIWRVRTAIMGTQSVLNRIEHEPDALASRGLAIDSRAALENSITKSSGDQSSEKP